MVKNPEYFVKVTCIAAFVIFFSLPLCAQNSGSERIHDFHNDIVINKDSSLTVTETISVQCEQIQIKRGIYRDFITRFKDINGNHYNTNLKIILVMRDGESEPFRIEHMSNGFRLYIGQHDVFLTKGQTYTYTIKYRIRHLLNFSADYDELYLNVKGIWQFPVDNASATVHLPDGVPLDNVSMSAYTDYDDRRGEWFESKINRDTNTIEFQTTAQLKPSECLTISVQFPKGYVKEQEFFRTISRMYEKYSFIIMIIVMIAVWLIYRWFSAPYRRSYSSGYYEDYYYEDYNDYDDYERYDSSDSDRSSGSGGGGGW